MHDAQVAATARKGGQDVAQHYGRVQVDDDDGWSELREASQAAPPIIMMMGMSAINNDGEGNDAAGYAF